MAKPSKAVMGFMEKYGVDSDEIWEVHGSTWVVKHKALERVAAEVGITWDRPAMLECNSADGVAALCVFGKLGERMEWSIGEALTVRQDRQGGNYKVTGKQAGYVYAMAEKRAKDRVILKLLSVSGQIYSEEESDDFKRVNPHVTRPEDVYDPVERDQNGQPVDNIQHVEPGKKLTVAEQRPVFSALQTELQATEKSIDLQTFAQSEGFLNRFALLKPDWQEFLRGVYAGQLTELRKQERGDDMRMAG